jgi:hypothetical protein
MKLLKAPRRNLGDGKPVAKEELIPDIKFHKHKFNNRPKPKDNRRVLFITNFSEFGCESLALLYCIPKIIQQYPGAYVICVGWYGREYLYRHLVDEYWELHEEFQWLREYTTAFRHTSRNLTKLEESLKQFGNVYYGVTMGQICLGNTCRDCKHFWGTEKENATCEKCNSDNIDRSLLADIPYHKKFAVQVPRPSMKMLLEAKKYLKPNSVGIFARGRVMYGRNLRPEFYVELIKLLEDQGYNPIWLGEKQSVLPCPVDHITDFSRLPESRNLELTLAIVSQLRFTVQFWTASTRFASMMGVPWILFESPDQIVGQGQEGKRIALTTDHNKKKLVLCQYHTVMEQEAKALGLVKQAIDEMNNDNWNDIVGLVDQPEIITAMLARQSKWR